MTKKVYQAAVGNAERYGVSALRPRQPMDLYLYDTRELVTDATRQVEDRDSRSLSMAKRGAVAHARLRIDACAANPHLIGAVY